MDRELPHGREGYDLMIAVDLSGRMLSYDFVRDGQPINRLEAIRPILLEFLRKRPNDRIGMVVFSGRAYTLCPLTFDHDWLLRQIERLKIGLIEDGTAIGDGIGVLFDPLGIISGSTPNSEEKAHSSS